MQVFQTYASPMQPCFTPPRHMIGGGHFVNSPMPMHMGCMSPFQSPQHVPFAATMASSPATQPAEQHFKYEIGNRMENTVRNPSGRYTIVRSLGSGVYGRVVECKDAEGKANVAIKAVRSEAVYRDAARREIRALQKVGVHENVCRMLRNFDFHGHICVVQELICGGTVWDKLKENGGYSLHETQGIAKQLLAGLAHIHKVDVLHTDIKTDNIMIDSISADGIPCIKIVDLGSAIGRNDPHPDMIGTKEYRSPEAVLQAGWSSPADIWALGCSLFEIFAGRKLFEFDFEITQLHMLERVLSTKIPHDMLRRACMKRNRLNAHLLSTSSCALAAPVPAEANKISAAMPLFQDVANNAFLSLLQQMLAVDPARRQTARMLQTHAFFSQELQEKKVPELPTGWEKKALLPSSSSEDLSVCSTHRDDKDETGTHTSSRRSSINRLESGNNNEQHSDSDSGNSSDDSKPSTVNLDENWAHLQDAPEVSKSSAAFSEAVVESKEEVVTFTTSDGKKIDGVRC
mmetsp:Transcript_14718/g.34945  ORF Transcript_14718/g.34945 Transcript_14718/m.34945 type:complete len:516 (-) Transcript_14718:221-1768(-)